MIPPKHIVLSRTDSIGDVMVTLPLVAWIKRHWPSCKIDFAGRAYTKDVIVACPHVDRFINVDEVLALHKDQAIAHVRALNWDAAVMAFPDPTWMRCLAEAEVPVRIATAGRWASWRYASHRVWFSRKKSVLHEAQLNAYLLRPLGFLTVPSLPQLVSGVAFLPQVDAPHELLPTDRPFVILHPKSKGSAVEWGIANFKLAAEQLTQKGYTVVITGTAAEGQLIRHDWDMRMPFVVDATGKLSLAQLIALIAHAHALVAASTGPLHIAAALGIRTVGLYTPKRPMHAGRWAPLGTNCQVLEAPGHPDLGQQLAIGVDDVLQAVMDNARD